MFGSKQVYCSVDKIAEAIPHLTGTGIGIEVLFDNTIDLWPQVRWENLLQSADAIAKADLTATIHGPFHGINLGSRDSHIREFSESVLKAALEACSSFNSPLVVFHTGFHPQMPPKSLIKWKDAFFPALERVLETAERTGVFLAMENTYETDTDLFTEIFSRVGHPQLRMCLDTGHATCFGKVDPVEWPTQFADRISHVHLSDNDGTADLHWALGTGRVDFETQLKPLAGAAHAITITYEVEGPDVIRSDEYFDQLMNLAT